MTPAMPARRTIKHLRWWIIGLVMLGTTVNYLARSSLGAAAPTLTKEMSLTTQEYSYIVAGFQLAYTVVQPFAGYILDLLGTKLGLFIFAIGWSLANMAHAFAGGWVSMAFFRGLLGLSEGGVIPASMKAVSEWFPDKERSVATGWFNIGSALGSMIAPPLVVWCILVGSWHWAFIVTGAIGLVWAAAWWFGYHPPQKHSRIGAEELVYIEAGQHRPELTAEQRKPAWGAILRTRKFWAIAIPRFLADPAWQTFTFWIPLYLVTVRGMDLKQIALFAWLPFLAADLGSIVGGYLSPFFMKFTGASLIRARKMTVLCGAVLMIGPACISLAPDAYWAIALFCVGGFAHQVLSGALITLSADLFPQHQVGTATGMGGTAAWTGGLLFSLLVGALANTIGYNPLFVCLAIFDLIGAVVIWSLLRDRDANQTPAAEAAG